MSSQGLLVAQILSRMMLQPDPECVHVILIASYSYQGCFKSHHLFVEHRGMTLLVTSSWHGIAGYVVTDATCSRDQIWRHHVPFCETNVNCFIFTGWQLYLLPSESRYSVEFIILLYQYCSNCVAIFCYAYTSLRFLGVVRILPPWQWRYWQGGVAIGNSERHVRKASHGGSKQQ